MDKYKILVVDDEPDLVSTLKKRLEADNYGVITASDGIEAFEKVKHVIMVTARAEVEDEKLGQETGADVYITKPFETNNLLSKVEELLSRKEA